MNDPLVTVPGIGPVKRNYLIAGGVVALLAGVYLYRQHQANAGSSAASTTAADAATDPATGYPTGSPEDLAALQQQNAQTAAAGAASGGAGGGGGLSVPPESTGYATNGAWSQAAQAYLVDSASGDPATVAAALGAYITGAAVTEGQKSVIEQAIAFAGYPPIAAPDGYPPHIRQVPVVVPPVVVPLLRAPRNVHQTTATRTSVTVAWDGVPEARYYVYANGHKSVLLSGTVWDLNQGHAGFPLKAGSRYTVQVSSVNTAGKEGPKSAAVAVHTAT